MSSKTTEIVQMLEQADALDASGKVYDSLVIMAAVRDKIKDSCAFLAKCANDADARGNVVAANRFDDELKSLVKVAQVDFSNMERLKYLQTLRQSQQQGSQSSPEYWNTIRPDAEVGGGLGMAAALALAKITGIPAWQLLAIPGAGALLGGLTGAVRAPFLTTPKANPNFHMWNTANPSLNHVDGNQFTGGGFGAVSDFNSLGYSAGTTPEAAATKLMSEANMINSRVTGEFQKFQSSGDKSSLLDPKSGFISSIESWLREADANLIYLQQNNADKKYDPLITNLHAQKDALTNLANKIHTIAKI